eukprot:138900_1
MNDDNYSHNSDDDVLSSNMTTPGKYRRLNPKPNAFDVLTDGMRNYKPKPRRQSIFYPPDNRPSNKDCRCDGCVIPDANVDKLLTQTDLHLNPRCPADQLHNAHVIAIATLSGMRIIITITTLGIQQIISPTFETAHVLNAIHLYPIKAIITIITLGIHQIIFPTFETVHVVNAIHLCFYPIKTIKTTQVIQMILNISRLLVAPINHKERDPNLSSPYSLQSSAVQERQKTELNDYHFINFR